MMLMTRSPTVVINMGEAGTVQLEPNYEAPCLWYPLHVGTPYTPLRHGVLQLMLSKQLSDVVGPVRVLTKA